MGVGWGSSGDEQAGEGVPMRYCRGDSVAGGWRGGVASPRDLRGSRTARPIEPESARKIKLVNVGCIPKKRWGIGERWVAHRARAFRYCTPFDLRGDKT